MSPDRRHGRTAAHRRAAAAAAAREARRRRQRRLRVGVTGVLGLVVVLALVLAMVPDSGDDVDDAATTTTLDAPTNRDSEGEIDDDPESTITEPLEYGTGECPPAEKPAEPRRQFEAAPRRCLDDGVDYLADVVTSEGELTIDLLEDRAPVTVNNFVVLARWGFYDDITVHRVAKDFVIQTGDPSGTGAGEIGYTFGDELPVAVTEYKKWAVAMANRGSDTNTSQWFVCLDCPSRLPAPSYSLFGQVIEGTEVVQAINDLGTGDGPPTRPVTVESVTIREQ